MRDKSTVMTEKSTVMTEKSTVMTDESTVFLTNGAASQSKNTWKCDTDAYYCFLLLLYISILQKIHNIYDFFNKNYPLPE